MQYQQQNTHRCPSLQQTEPQKPKKPATQNPQKPETNRPTSSPISAREKRGEAKKKKKKKNEERVSGTRETVAGQGR